MPELEGKNAGEDRAIMPGEAPRVLSAVQAKKPDESTHSAHNHARRAEVVEHDARVQSQYGKVVREGDQQITPALAPPERQKVEMEEQDSPSKKIRDLYRDGRDIHPALRSDSPRNTDPYVASESSSQTIHGFISASSNYSISPRLSSSRGPSFPETYDRKVAAVVSATSVSSKEDERKVSDSSLKSSQTVPFVLPVSSTEEYDPFTVKPGAHRQLVDDGDNVSDLPQRLGLDQPAVFGRHPSTSGLPRLVTDTSTPFPAHPSALPPPLVTTPDLLNTILTGFEVLHTHLDGDSKSLREDVAGMFHEQNEEFKRRFDDMEAGQQRLAAAMDQLRESMASVVSRAPHHNCQQPRSHPHHAARDHPSGLRRGGYPTSRDTSFTATGASSAAAPSRTSFQPHGSNAIDFESGGNRESNDSLKRTFTQDL